MFVFVDELWINVKERIMFRRYDLFIDNIYVGNFFYVNFLLIKM